MFDKSALESASPISYVHREAPPFLLINAEYDAGLEEDAEAFRVALKNCGAANIQPAILQIPGTHHLSLITSIQDYLPNARRHEVMKYCLSFFKECLV